MGRGREGAERMGKMILRCSSKMADEVVGELVVGKGDETS